ncbi:hypothetical protein Tco_0604401 [Tanacetum coccineum]
MIYSRNGVMSKQEEQKAVLSMKRMSAKGEKIVGKSPVFIGQTGGAWVVKASVQYRKHILKFILLNPNMRVHVNETKQDSMCLKKVPWKGWPTISGEGDEVSNWTSSGVIGKRVRLMSIDAFS